MPVEVTIEGFEEMAKKLEALGQSVGDVMRAAVIKAAEPIKQDMISRIHSVDGDLASSIQIVARRGRENDWQGVRVQATPPKGAHAHLVEFGHALVKGGTLKQGGVVIGNVPAHPFARPARRAKGKIAEAIITEELRRAIMEVVG